MFRAATSRERARSIIRGLWRPSTAWATTALSVWRRFLNLKIFKPWLDFGRFSHEGKAGTKSRFGDGRQQGDRTRHRDRLGSRGRSGRDQLQNGRGRRRSDADKNQRARRRG